MPLKLVPPREGKTPNYYVRGTYYGVGVNATTGTPDRAKARKAVERIKADIERGAYTPAGALTFAGAALSYVQAGGESLYVERLAEHFGTRPAAAIDQAAIDEAAHALYPKASGATRNRQVYTPISAILKHAKIDFKVKRPKGAQGLVKSGWVRPERAFVLFEKAGELDDEFRIFLMTLCYAGLRLSEGIWSNIDNLYLAESFAFIGKTKNGEPRPVHLPPIIVTELKNHPRGLNRPGDTIFRFRKNGHLYKLLKETKDAAGMPEVTFHTLRHTWATWMRRYAGVDVKGLVATGAWKDEKSAARYAHVVVSEEAARADHLPTPNGGKSVEFQRKRSILNG